MAQTSRQTTIFGIEDWKKIYETYSDADFQSYNFETLRKTFIDYIRQNYPESFNDYTESSEFVALMDLIAFMGQSMSFRVDLNSRENFLDTAERRDSVVNLAKLVGYTPKRNQAAKGYLKVTAIQTTESLLDYNQNSLANVTVKWNDRTNPDWQEQFRTIMNAVLVDSQSIGKPGNSADILGTRTDEYAINLAPNLLPVVPFNATVDGLLMDFEICSGTSVDKDYVYENAPRSGGAFNVLYRNDGLGFAAPNTGYFFHFKQGKLESRDFNLTERIANRIVDISIDGINENDVWLYKLSDNEAEPTLWTQVENVYGEGQSQRDVDNRNLYSINSRSGDQVSLQFGDGVFSNIPVGDFRSFFRSSNGLEYVINPSEMQAIDVSLTYTSRKGRFETVTFTLGLQENISNSRQKENLADIKRRAPARFYTQNRMVNGEDYNNFPYTKYSTIIKSKAVNRTNIGASRYLDLVDPTGKYSSINAFGSDGSLYKQYKEQAFGFTFNDQNDVENIIRNQVEPVLASQPTQHFYYDQYERKDLTGLPTYWERSTSLVNETTGFFKSGTGPVDQDNGPYPVSIGGFENNNRRYLTVKSLVKFVAPTGYYFDKNNRLQPGIATSAGQKYHIWSTIKSIESGGLGSNFGLTVDGTGAVTISDYVPTDAIVEEVIPVFTTNLTTEFEQLMADQIELYRNFGLGYDNNNGEWYLITANNLDADGTFDQLYAQDVTNQNLDASWLIKFESSGSSYTVTTRSLNYYFASVAETRFFFDNNFSIYDNKTGKIVNDFVKILKTNSQPDTNAPLINEVQLDIIDQTVESDGFVNDFNVEVSFSDTDYDGVPDDPDVFETLVATEVNPSVKKVFFQRTVDFDNLERYLPLNTYSVVTDFSILDEIEVNKYEYSNGQVFYAYAEDTFYVLTVTSTDRFLEADDSYVAEVGRGDLQFQYKHNASESRRINPGVSNIIDIFVVTNSYYQDFRRYIQDTTNTIEKPAQPTIDELSVAYEDLNDYKMMSDNIILNSVEFKPLFGERADSTLQAIIKVVKLSNTVVAESEIKSRVIETINAYFDIDNWDFGDTFYFSELSAYVHEQLGSIIGSVVILPKDPSKQFGDLYEIKSAANEIFVSAATVNDVEIVDSLTASELRLNGEV